MNAEGTGTIEKTGYFPTQTAFGCPADFLDNRYVYIVISPRMRGLAIGINISPEVHCNFECICCEVRRDEPEHEELDVKVMAAEFKKTLQLVQSGEIADLPDYRRFAPELLKLRQVVLSGTGEPTLAPHFEEAMERVVHLRACKPASYYKLVLPTNGSFLDLPGVQNALKFLTSADEIWIKLDAGTQAGMTRINGRKACLDKVLKNILLVGRKRPVVIQSIFPSFDGAEPDQHEFKEYVNRLKELKEAGADISMVHIYSASRPASITSGCGHLSLKTLSKMCSHIKQATGIRAEFF